MIMTMCQNDQTERYPNMDDAINVFEKTREFKDHSKALSVYKADLDQAEGAKPPESFLSHREWKLVDRVASQTHFMAGFSMSSPTAAFESLFIAGFTRLGYHANSKLRAQVITECLALPRSGTTLKGGCLHDLRMMI
jgi:hypothetical protein